MADTKIGMKIEEEIKPLKELCEKLVKMATAELDQNPQAVDTHEMYEVVDMIKDLAEAKKDTVEACYKMTISEAMEENADEYGDTWDEDGLINQRRGYRGQPRSKTSGRYMSRYDGRRNNYTEPIEYRMDMDLYRMNPDELRRRDNMMTGVHYYTDNGVNVSENTTPNSSAMRNGNNANSGMRMGYDNGWNDGYSEGKRSGGGSTRLDRARKNYEDKHDMESLEEMMSAIQEEIKKQEPHMDTNQKSMTKSKLTTLINSIK